MSLPPLKQRKSLLWLTEEPYIRLGMAAFVILVLLVAPQIVVSPTDAWIAVAAMAGGILLSRSTVRNKFLAVARRVEVAELARTFWDLLYITLLVHAAGGPSSPFALLYPVALVLAARALRYLDMACLLGATCVLYAGVSFLSDMHNELWQLWVRLPIIALVSWSAMALTARLDQEKEGRTELVRHLGLGLVLLDRDGRVALVSDAFRYMFGLMDIALMGRTYDEIANINPVLQWVMRDVAPLKDIEHKSTRAAGFPEFGLPDLRVTTISCPDEDATGARWIVICQDLRREPSVTLADADTFHVSPSAQIELLRQAMSYQACQLNEEERWRALSLIEEHTAALQALLTRSFHALADHEEADTNPTLINVRRLLHNTRRLLSVHSSHREANIHVVCAENLPPLRGNRGTLGRLVLRLARAVLGFAESDDMLRLSAEQQDHAIILGFELLPPPGVVPTPMSRPDDLEQALPSIVGRAVKALAASLDECAAEWSYEPGVGRYFAVRVTLRLPQQSFEPAPGQREEPAVVEVEEVVLDREQDHLSTPTLNALNNSLAAIRGYAEVALSWPPGGRLQQVLAEIVGLADQASEALETAVEGEDKKAFGPTVSLRPASPRITLRPDEKGEWPAVLVVDDVQSVREVLVEVLAQTPCPVKAFGDGESAISYLRREAPALAFVDLMMPGRSGADVLRVARQLHPETPVVIMSGGGSAALTEALEGLQPDYVLEKPFSVEAIWSVLSQFMETPIASQRAD